MKKTKPTFADVEAFHDEDDYVILCLPEYLKDIKSKLQRDSILIDSENTVSSPRQVDGNLLHTVEMYMKELRLPYTPQTIQWFEAHKDSFKTEDMDPT